MRPWRERIADLLGLSFLVLALLDYFRPSLLFLPTIAAGGDTPCHYPTAAYVHDWLLPRMRLHGWYPGAYLGHPLLLYYFPLPFLVMSALAPMTGLPVAFKLGTVLGVFLLPLLVYLAFRLMGLRFPGPLLGATAAVVFLFLEENPIWGGTMASTLTGEFSYTYGIGLAVLSMGAAYRAFFKARSPLAPAALLGLTALAHGYAVLWAGLSACYFLYLARRPLRTLAWLALLALLGFAFAGLFLVPLLADWRWTTPYHDPWITIATRNLVPPFLWPLLAVAGLGVASLLAWSRRTGRLDHQPLFLLHAALVAAALAAAGPALGVIDVRFVPFAQLAGCLAAAAALGLALRGFAAADLAALGLVVLGVVYGDAHSRVLRHWIEWNYSGLEAKELWPAWKQLTSLLAGSVSDPRVAVEYSPEHERAGSIRMYETLPLFTGRSTIEGVYNQASLQTHAVYYLASELGESSPNPFRSRIYSNFDTDRALHHLRMFNVREVVALSTKLAESLRSRDDVTLLAHIPPYRVFRLKDPGAGYVEPMRYAPVRSSPEGWRDKAYRWFSRQPPSPAHLVFTGDDRFGTVEPDEWLPPPEVPLEPGVKVRSVLQTESLEIETNRPGHPLLVKVSYHPRWKAEGADGPYLVSPALMMVVPRQTSVRLVYSRTWADTAGLALTVAALALFLWPRLRRRLLTPEGPEPPSGPGPDSPRPAAWRRHWASAIPAGLLLTLAVLRFLPGREVPAAGAATGLSDRASVAYAEGRFEAAAEYARQALAFAEAPEELASLECLRAEALMRAGRFSEAAASFESAIHRLPQGPYAPQALFGLVRAREASGDLDAAARTRERLRKEFPDTPWTGMLDKKVPDP